MCPKSSSSRKFNPSVVLFHQFWHALKLVSWSSAERYIYIAEPFDLDYASVVGVTQCSYSTKCTYLSQKLSMYMEMNEFAPAL